MSTQHAQYVLLFLALVVNPTELHALTQVACSYALLVHIWAKFLLESLAITSVLVPAW